MAERDADEPGLAGVTIYADLNLNNQLDPHEPTAVTQRDNPFTERDESGVYSLFEMPAGFYIIREVVPEEFRQTFPEPFLCEATFCIGARAHGECRAWRFPGRVWISGTSRVIRR